MKEKLFKLLFPTKAAEIRRLRRSIELGNEHTAHLLEDLQELALRPESFKSINIAAAIKWGFDMEKMMWFGSREATNETHQCGN
jgi:hypothetical protein